MINCTWWQRCLELCYICFAVLHVFNSLCRVLIIPNITQFFLVWKQFITDRIHNLALRNLRFKAGGSVVKNWCSFAFYVIWATVLVSEIHFLYNCDLLFRWHIKLRFYIPIIHICVKNKKKTKKTILRPRFEWKLYYCHPVQNVFSCLCIKMQYCA